MAGVCKINIQESEEQLKVLLHQQKLAQNKERVQLLYVLKSGQVQSVSQAAHLLGRHRVTLQGWLSLYIEQVWQYLKRGLRWRNFQNLDELRKELTKRLEGMTKEVIASITGRRDILQALCVAGI